MVENSEIPHLRDTVEELRYSESKVVSFYEEIHEYHVHITQLHMHMYKDSYMYMYNMHVHVHVYMYALVHVYVNIILHFFSFRKTTNQ